MSGSGFEQFHQGPPGGHHVDHSHLSDGLHGPGRHGSPAHPTADGTKGAGSRGQTEGGGTGSGGKPTQGTGGGTEGGGGTSGGGGTEGGGGTHGGGGGTEGGGGGPTEGGGGSTTKRLYAPTAQRHNFHLPQYREDQTVTNKPGSPAGHDVYTTTTSQTARTSTTQRLDSIDHTHSGYLQSTETVNHKLQYVPGQTAKHFIHEIPPVHHHHHISEHHPIHHKHHIHRGLTPHEPTAHKHPVYHTHHPIHHHLVHHPVDQTVDKTAHPHKEVTTSHTVPGHIVTHDTTSTSMVIVPKVTKREAQIVQEQSTTMHSVTVRQKVDIKPSSSDSTVVINTPPSAPTTAVGPNIKHFEPTNSIQVEANNQGSESATVSRTITPRDALSARIDFDRANFANLSIVDDHALFPTLKKDGEPVNANVYIQAGGFFGKQTTTEGLLPFDKKSGLILGANGYYGLGHDRQLYGGVNYSTGEGFADFGLQQDFNRGSVYGGLQYSVAKGFSPTHSVELGGSLRLGHSSKSPSLFMEGTVPLDLKTNQRPTVWTGLRISF